MKRMLFLIILLGLSSSQGFAQTGDLARFEGTWACTSRYEDDKKDTNFSRFIVVYKANAFTIYEHGKPTLKGLITLGSSQNLNGVINSRVISGKNADRTFPGIYKFDDKSKVLELCFGKDGRRPEGFTAREGQVFERLVKIPQ